MMVKTQHSSFSKIDNTSIESSYNGMVLTIPPPLPTPTLSSAMMDNTGNLQQEIQEWKVKAETDHNLGICALRRLALVEDERDKASKLLTSEKNSVKKLEESLLNMNMKLKLKEATIKRLTPATEASSSSSSSSSPPSALHGESDANEISSEIDLLKEELRL